MDIPVPPPGVWNTQILKSATWGPTEVTMTRDGSTVIPDSATFTVHAPDGTLLLTQSVSIDGGGVMTVAALTATETGAIDWQYGNLLLKVTEDGPPEVVTDLLAGNVTVRDYGA